ncbi:MerR family transcriptional regulator [bacterium]|nr:MerR family transcriptional regulator [bacterium]
MDNNEYFASINEVSKRLSVPAHTLRYWEKQFPVAVRPITGAGGRRYYRVDTIERLMAIKDLLYNRGMTIAGVKKMMRDGMFSAAMDATSSDDAVAKSEPNVMDASRAVDVNRAIDMLKRAREILAGGDNE